MLIWITFINLHRNQKDSLSFTLKTPTHMCAVRSPHHGAHNQPESLVPRARTQSLSRRIFEVARTNICARFDVDAMAKLCVSVAPTWHPPIPSILHLKWQNNSNDLQEYVPVPAPSECLKFTSRFWETRAQILTQFINLICI